MLVAVGVRSCQKRPLDTEGVIEDLQHRRHTVGRAGGVRDDPVVHTELVVVDPHRHREVHLVHWRRAEDHALRAALEVLLEIGVRACLAGRFDDDVDAELVPGRLPRLDRRQHRNLLADNVEVLLANTQLLGERAENRVESNQVLHSGGVRDLVDRGDPDFLIAIQDAQ